MKPFAFLFILILCTACVPQGLPVTESSPTLIATQFSIATIPPTSTSLPTSTTPALLLPSPTPIFNILIDNVATDQQGVVYVSGFGKQDDLRHFARWDGGKWIELGNGFKTTGNALAVDSTGHLYAEIFTDSQQGMSNAIMRWDGAKWEDITGNFSIVVDALQAGRLSSNIPVMALAVDGEDNLYTAGSYFYPSADNTAEWAMGYVAKWNKDSWTVLGQGFDKVYITAMETVATGNVYVSGEQPLTPEGNNSFITQWDNDTWTEINTSKLINLTQIIAVDRSGRLYANSQWAVVSYWDGTDWINITDQLKGEAPAVYDMAVGRNDHLCIGGSFESVNAIPARNIACWDGSSWYALGDGVNERVNAIAFDPYGDLYAVGYFTEAGGLPVDHAARWDGETWYALGQ
jgi:hypothetical protein